MIIVGRAGPADYDDPQPFPLSQMIYPVEVTTDDSINLPREKYKGDEKHE